MDTLPKPRLKVKPTSRPSSMAIEKRGNASAKLTRKPAAPTPSSLPTLLAVPPPLPSPFTMPSTHPPTSPPYEASNWPSWVGGKVTNNLEMTYSFGEQLGRPGAYGYAILAVNKTTKQQVAIKVVDKTQLCREDLDSLASELNVMSQISHPIVAGLIETAESPTHVKLVMSPCYGGELLDRLTATGVFPEHLTRVVSAQLLWCLHYLHNCGVAHCDLKPDNILFRNNPKNPGNMPCPSPFHCLTVSPSDAINVIDFGLAKFASPGACFKEITGTPYYIAPEVLQGQYSLHCDMWAVGVLVFIMLLGFAPFDADDLDSPLIRQQLDTGFLSAVRPGRGPWFPQEQPISQSAKHLITHLLDKSIMTRLTATEALYHPFILGTGVPAALELLTMLVPYTFAHPMVQCIAEATVHTQSMRHHTAAVIAAVRELTAASGKKSDAGFLDLPVLESLLNRTSDAYRGHVRRLIALLRYHGAVQETWRCVFPSIPIPTSASQSVVLGIEALTVDEFARAVCVWWLCNKAERAAVAFGSVVRTHTNAMKQGTSTGAADIGTVLMHNGTAPRTPPCGAAVPLGTGVCVDATALVRYLDEKRVRAALLRPNVHVLRHWLQYQSHSTSSRAASANGSAGTGAVLPSPIELAQGWFREGAVRFQAFLTDSAAMESRNREGKVNSENKDPKFGYFASFFRKSPLPPAIPECPLGNSCSCFGAAVSSASGRYVAVDMRGGSHTISLHSDVDHHLDTRTGNSTLSPLPPLCLNVCISEPQFLFAMGVPHHYNTLLPPAPPALYIDHASHTTRVSLGRAVMETDTATGKGEERMDDDPEYTPQTGKTDPELYPGSVENPRSPNTARTEVQLVGAGRNGAVASGMGVGAPTTAAGAGASMGDDVGDGVEEEIDAEEEARIELRIRASVVEDEADGHAKHTQVNASGKTTGKGAGMDARQGRSGLKAPEPVYGDDDFEDETDMGTGMGGHGGEGGYASDFEEEFGENISGNFPEEDVDDENVDSGDYEDDFEADGGDGRVRRNKGSGKPKTPGKTRVGAVNTPGKGALRFGALEHGDKDLILGGIAGKQTAYKEGDNFEFGLGVLELQESESARAVREERERKKAEMVKRAKEEEERKARELKDRERREEMEWKAKQKQEREKAQKAKEEEWLREAEFKKKQRAAAQSGQSPVSGTHTTNSNTGTGTSTGENGGSRGKSRTRSVAPSRRTSIATQAHPATTATAAAGGNATVSDGDDAEDTNSGMGLRTSTGADTGVDESQLTERERAVLRMKAELAALRQRQEEADMGAEEEESEDEGVVGQGGRRGSLVRERKEKRRREQEMREKEEEERREKEKEERERREREVAERRQQRIRAEKERERKERERQEKERAHADRERERELERRRGGRNQVSLVALGAAGRGRGRNDGAGAARDGMGHRGEAAVAARVEVHDSLRSHADNNNTATTAGTDLNSVLAATPLTPMRLSPINTKPVSKTREGKVYPGSDVKPHPAPVMKLRNSPPPRPLRSRSGPAHNAGVPRRPVPGPARPMANSGLPIPNASRAPVLGMRAPAATGYGYKGGVNASRHDESKPVPVLPSLAVAGVGRTRPSPLLHAHLNKQGSVQGLVPGKVTDSRNMQDFPENGANSGNDDISGAGSPASSRVAPSGRSMPIVDLLSSGLPLNAAAQISGNPYQRYTLDDSHHGTNSGYNTGRSSSVQDLLADTHPDTNASTNTIAGSTGNGGMGTKGQGGVANAHIRLTTTDNPNRSRASLASPDRTRQNHPSSTSTSQAASTSSRNASKPPFAVSASVVSHNFGPPPPPPDNSKYIHLAYLTKLPVAGVGRRKQAW